MNKYNWVAKIKLCITLLRLVGLWPKGNSAYHLDLYLLQAVTFTFVFYVCHIIFQSVNIYFIKDNLADVTGTAYILGLEIMLAFKIYYLVKNLKTLKHLLKILDSDRFQPKSLVQINAIETNVWNWNLTYKTFLYSSIGANLFWALYPLVDKKVSGEKRLPFLAWFPFNASTSPGYEVAYVYQVASTAFITVVHSSTDALAAALAMFNGSQFDIFCDNLRNLHQLGENVSKNLIKCIQHHKEILQFADKCNEFLNWILFVQIFVSAFSIGITMFQLTQVVPMSNQFFSLFLYGIAITAQAYMYCFFGNEVQIKSDNIRYAAFECDWTNFPLKIQKDLLFFTLRAQKPVKLSAFNLFFLSLEAFMKILKTSWSYFALLHQVQS